MPLDNTYLKVSNGGGDAAMMHVINPRSINATTISVDTVANVPEKFIATYGELLPNGFIDPATAVNFYGRLSGSDLEIDGFLPGTTDNGNSVGDVVVIRPNTFWANQLVSYLDDIKAAVDHFHADNVIVSVSETQPDPDPSGSTILWAEPI